MRGPFAIAAAVVSAGLTYGRLFYGVDFTDEAFYVAVPYRFVLGAQPLVDETNIVQQTPGVLLYPLYALWHAIAGSDGIVLYARHLHFLFTAGVAALLFLSLRRLRFDAASSLVLACTAVVFVPFGIHGLSYNTFGSGFFTAGCLLGAAWTATGSRKLLVASGFGHALAVFTYPTLVPAVICCFAALYLASRPRSLRSLVPGLMPFVVGVLATGAFFLHRGIETIRELVRRTGEVGEQGGDLGELVDVLDFVWTSFAYKYVAIGILLALAAARRWRPALAIVPLSLVPLTALPDDLRTSASSNVYVTSFALLAPLLLLCLRDDELSRRLVTLVWAPAAVAGLTTAMTSGNGGINVAIGFFPALLVTGALSVLALSRTPSLALAPVAVVLAVGVALQYLSVYRDNGIQSLTTAIGSGPYAGILTTPAKRDFLISLDRDVEATTGPGCRIVYYDTFPAGYLLGHGAPATNAAWFLDVDDEKETRYQRLLLDHYRAHGRLPDVAVRLDRIPLTTSDGIGQSYDAGEPLERAFGPPGYAEARRTGWYRITKARGATC